MGFLEWFLGLKFSILQVMVMHFFISETLQILMRAISSPPFRSYDVWWSLSDSKYAGTALFVKKCFPPKKVSFSLDRTGSLMHDL